MPGFSQAQGRPQGIGMQSPPSFQLPGASSTQPAHQLGQQMVANPNQAGGNQLRMFHHRGSTGNGPQSLKLQYQINGMQGNSS